MKTAQAPPSYRRDRARMPAAQRREQIMAVTCQIIAERGFWGLSMQDVADRCGLTVPGLLHHVGSKDGLLIAVLEYRDDEDARSLAEELGLFDADLSADWAAGTLRGVDLAQVCSALVRRNASQPEIVRLFAVLEAESLTPSHPAHDYFATRQRQTIDVFTALADAVTGDPGALARQIMAMMDGLQIQWLRDPDSTDLVREWEAAATALLGRPNL